MQKLLVVLSVLAVICAAHSFKEDGKVKQLTVDTFTAVTGIGSGQLTKNTFGMFYAPWCGHCKKLIPTYEQFAEQATDINVAAVDCTQHRAICDQLDVKGYPTLLYFTTDNKQIKYSKARTLEAMTAFAANDYKTESGVDISFKPVGRDAAAASLTGVQATVQNLINTVGGPVPFVIGVVAALIVLAVFLSLICGSKKEEQQTTKEDKQTKTKKRD